MTFQEETNLHNGKAGELVQSPPAFTLHSGRSVRCNPKAVKSTDFHNTKVCAAIRRTSCSAFRLLRRSNQGKVCALGQRRRGGRLPGASTNTKVHYGARPEFSGEVHGPGPPSPLKSGYMPGTCLLVGWRVT